MFDNDGNDTVDRNLGPMSDPGPVTGWQVVTWNGPANHKTPFKTGSEDVDLPSQQGYKADGSRGRVTCQLDPISSEELPQ